MKTQLTLICCLFTMIAFGQNVPGNISNVLLNRMETMPGESQSVIIVMQEQADLEEMDNRFRRDRTPQKERVQELLPLLQNSAERSQKNLIEFLTTKEGYDSKDIRSLWISSLVVIEAKEQLIHELAGRQDVNMVMWNSPTFVEEHDCEEIAPEDMVVEPNNAERGLKRINADKLWAMGYTGYGAIAFGSDTGIEPFHPSYNNRWLGLYGDKNLSWYEWNSNNTIPFECGDHGMHTLGTMVGVDQLTRDTIGVAPQANWVGAPTLCTGGGTADNIGAFEWSLNPDGDANTISDMPTVINNSWWDPSQQGNDCSSVYIQPLIVAEMAGVAIVFSAGNGGPGPSTITAPKNINVSEINSFTVGNLNGNANSLLISSGSSRGPSICGGDSSILIKPEVSAPGTSVRSSELDRTYGNKTGTSMAAPHVAGAMLLLKEAFPDLLSEDFKLALYLTARDLGPLGEDNDYGMGIIDCEAAFNYLVDLGNTPTIPNTDLDLIGADTDAQLEYCTTEMNLSFFVKNGGSTTINSFDYELDIESLNGNIAFQFGGSWTGSIAKNEITRIEIPVTDDDLNNGNYLVIFRSLNPNGEQDPRPLNNALGKLITFDASTPISLEVNGVDNGTACDSSTVKLIGEVPGFDDYYFKWYSDYQTTDLLAEGTSYEFEMGSEPVELFLESYTLEVGGEKVPPTGEYTSDNALEFQVTDAVEINTVDVYAEEPGNRFLQVKRANGDPVVTIPIFVENVGINTLDLDIQLEEGIYTMSFFINKPLLEMQGTLDYPYSVGSDIKITGASKANSYPYFFNWTIEQPYGCEKQSITIEPNGALDMELGFDFPTDLVYTDDQVAISNTSTGGVQYDWLVNGVLEVENMENPVLSFSEWGQYDITMIATNANGCQSSFSQVLNVNFLTNTKLPGDGYNFEMFPNPAQDIVQVNLTIPNNIEANLGLLDNLGRTMPIDLQSVKGSNSFSLDVSDLSAGIYFFEVRIVGQPSWVHKLIVQ